MKAIQKTISFNFSTTIALFSGGPQHDRHAKLIIDKIKKSSKGGVSFVGTILFIKVLLEINLPNNLIMFMLLQKF